MLLDVEANSNMKKVEDIEKIQNLLYELMNEFHRICEENNLYYSIFGGTLLGAIRHQAIIPWDDDIDVCMPRKDYEKFCELVNDKYSYRLIVEKFPQKNYVYNFAKFCLKDSLLIENELLHKYSMGKLYIDVFPIDGYPPKEQEKQHFDKLRLNKKIIGKIVCKIKPSKIWWKKPFVIIRALERFLYRVVGYKHFLKTSIDESEKYDFDNYEYVSMQGAGWYEKGKLKKETFMRRKLYKFGNLEVWGIEDYDEHLTRLYGDYMTPPPEEKRKSNHSYDLYLEEKYEN